MARVLTRTPGRAVPRATARTGRRPPWAGAGGGGGPGSAATAEPRLIVVYGDSFAQRGMDILGSPNVLDSNVVDPQNLRWPSDDTSRIGGVQWGFTSVIQDHSAGRYVFAQEKFWGIGGFNTGQLSRVDTTEPYWLTLFVTMLSDAIDAGWPIAAVLVHAGVNDHLPAGSIWNAAGTYARILPICQAITALGIPVIVNNLPPRGHASATSARAATPQNVLDANALLAANLAAEPSVDGLVRVVDIWTPLHDPGGASNDVYAADVYDGLHLNKNGCLKVGRADIAALDALFDDVLIDPYADAENYLANAGFATATGGTITRSGNDATNTGFGIATGVMPASWELRSCGGSVNEGLGLTAWNGTDPNNIKGTVVASVDDDEIVVDIACTPGSTNANSRALRVSQAVTLPSTDDLPVGAYFEALCEATLTGQQGLRGVSLTLGITQPDASVRWVHSDIAAPNGTANMDIASGANMTDLLMRTPPTIRKTGTYGTIMFAVFLYVAGGASTIAGQLRIKRPKVRRARYLDAVT